VLVSRLGNITLVFKKNLGSLPAPDGDKQTLLGIDGILRIPSVVGEQTRRFGLVIRTRKYGLSKSYGLKST